MHVIAGWNANSVKSEPSHTAKRYITEQLSNHNYGCTNDQKYCNSSYPHSWLLLFYHFILPLQAKQGPGLFCLKCCLVLNWLPNFTLVVSLAGPGTLVSQTYRKWLNSTNTSSPLPTAQLPSYSVKCCWTRWAWLICKPCCTFMNMNGGISFCPEIFVVQVTEVLSQDVLLTSESSSQSSIPHITSSIREVCTCSVVYMCVCICVCVDNPFYSCYSSLIVLNMATSIRVLVCYSRVDWSG